MNCSRLLWLPIAHGNWQWSRRNWGWIAKQVAFRFDLTSQPEFYLCYDSILFYVVYYNVQQKAMSTAIPTISDLLPSFLAGVWDIFTWPDLYLFLVLGGNLKSFYDFIKLHIKTIIQVFRLHSERWKWHRGRNKEAYQPRQRLFLRPEALIQEYIVM